MGRASARKPLAAGVVVSLLVHVTVGYFASSEHSEVRQRIRMPVLDVRLNTRIPAKSAEPPAYRPGPASSTVESGEVSMADAAAPEPVPPSPAGAARRNPLDLRRPDQLDSDEAGVQLPEGLGFRPDFGRRLIRQKAERSRKLAVLRNEVQRLGLGAEVVNGPLQSLARIGDHCYTVSAPVVTLQRGTGVAQVPCPGRRPWWERDALDEVAQVRGIP